MAVRTSMAALIARTRTRINDVAGPSQIFTDQEIQDILDATRVDYRYLQLRPTPSYVGGNIQYLDYYTDLGDWEDDVVFTQWLTITTTPTTSEPIVGKWSWAVSTFPPVYIAYGKTYDVWRAAADLLEQWAAQWTLAYTFSSDGQSFQRSQVLTNLQTLAQRYRRKQRPYTIKLTRSDITNKSEKPHLGASLVDRFSSGDDHPRS